MTVAPKTPVMVSTSTMTEEIEASAAKDPNNDSNTEVLVTNQPKSGTRKTFLCSESDENDIPIDFFDALLPASDKEPEESVVGEFDTAIEQENELDENQKDESTATECNLQESNPFVIGESKFPCTVSETKSLAADCDTEGSSEQSNHRSVIKIGTRSSKIEDYEEAVEKVARKSSTYQRDIDAYKNAGPKVIETSSQSSEKSVMSLRTPEKLNRSSICERILSQSSSVISLSPRVSRIQIEKLDDHARRSFASCSQKSNDVNSGSSVKGTPGRLKKRNRLVSTSSDEMSDSEKLAELKRKQTSPCKSPISNKKSKRCRILDSDFEDSDHQLGLDAELLRVPKFKKPVSRAVNESSSNCRRKNESLDEDGSEDNMEVSQSVFRRRVSNTVGEMIPNEDEIFDEANDSINNAEISNSRNELIGSDDSTTDEDAPLGEKVDEYTLENITLDRNLKDLQKRWKNRKTKNSDKAKDRSVSPASTVTLSSDAGSESEDKKSDKVIRLPTGLQKSRLLLNKDPTSESKSKQSTLNFTSSLVKKENVPRRGIPNLKQHFKKSCNKIQYEDSDDSIIHSSSNEDEKKLVSESTRSKNQIGSAKTISSSSAGSKNRTNIGNGKFGVKARDPKIKARCNKSSEATDSEDSLSDSEAENRRRKRIREVIQANRMQRFKNQARVSDEDDDVREINPNSITEPRRSRKPNRIMTDAECNKETRKACREEKERIARVNRYAKKGLYKWDLVGDAKVYSKVWLEKVSKNGVDEPLVEVQDKVACQLKEHQVDGIEFMYNCLLESVQRSKTSDGSGCILAHCMGLGKTLQVIAFLDAVLSSANLEHFQRAIVIAPCSTLFNWKKEFKSWLGRDRNFSVLNLDRFKRDRPKMMQKLHEWSEERGVLIIGYEMFTNLVRQSMAGTTDTAPRPRSRIPFSDEHKELVRRALVDPGADFVICDEGHELKNDKTAKAKNIKLVKTRRRIILTGTPLQNNMTEYFVMMDFVKPFLLGNKKEFSNRFSTPIDKGQKRDAGKFEVKLMQKRTHVLHKQLSGCVHRRDFSYIKKLLPQKREFTLEIKMCDLQKEMYLKFLEMYVQAGTQTGAPVDAMEEFEIKRSAITNLFRNKNMLTKILCHPIATLRTKNDEFACNGKKKEETKLDELREELGTVADILEKSLGRLSLNDNITQCQMSTKFRPT